MIETDTRRIHIMNILRRSNHDAEDRDSSPFSEMKRRNHVYRDDLSATDTAELSAESAERNNSSFFSSRKSAPTDHIGDDVVDMVEQSGEASSVGSSSMVRQRHNKAIHTHNNVDNDVELLDLKAPAPMEPNQFTKEEYEEMIQEYENEIVRLEKLNATLSANVAALYAENAAAEEELCHHGPETSATTRPSLGIKQTSMEMSPDEEYAPREDDMILAEDQYLHEIAKHQKANNKLKKQLDTQKKLVSKLSLHLKTSADKITALNKEKEEWKTKVDSSINSTTGKTHEDPYDDVHKYQIQVIQNELISLQNLMMKNSKAHRRDRQKMLEEYRNEDALWTSKLEQPMATMQRIIQSVTGINNNRGIIDTPVEDHLERKPAATLDKKESMGNNSGFNVLDSMASLFGQNNKNEAPQSKVEIDAHPLSTEIKSFDVSRLKKTVVVVEESHSKLDEEKDIAEEVIENSVDEDNDPDRKEQMTLDEGVMNVSESECHRELRLNDNELDVDPSQGEDTKPVLEDEGNHVGDSAEDDTAKFEDTESHPAGLVNKLVTGAAAVFDDEKDAHAGNDKAYVENASNVEVDASTVEVVDPEAREDEIHEVEGKADDASSDEESMYDDYEGKYVAREGKEGVEHTDDRETDNEVGEAGLTGRVATDTAEISDDAMKLQSNDCSVDSESQRDGGEGDVVLIPGPEEINDVTAAGEPAAISTGEDIPAVTQSIDAEKEDTSSPEAEKTCGQLDDKPVTPYEDDKRILDDGKEEDVKSMSHYQNVISHFTLGDSSVSALSKNSKNSKKSFNSSRKQLFQREGLSCSDLFVDVVDNVFHIPGERKVLVDSKNGRDSVPPYEPPTLPTEKKRDAQHYKRGAKDGYYIYKSSSGNEYSGHWKSGRRHGYGMAKYRDGEVFHGDWRRGRRHGHGVLHLANKDVFDGDWDTNQKHGLGVYFWADGEVDVSWYEKDVRMESVRWTKDRRLAYLLDLKGSKKEQISLNKAAKIVRGWEKKAEVFDC